MLVNKLATQIPKDKPKIAANAIQECLGGKFVEMNTNVAIFISNFGFRGKAGPSQPQK